MTNEELFEDLKQFVTATISQQTSQLEHRMATKEDIQALDKRIDQLDNKLDEIQDAIADAFTHTTNVANESISNVENALGDHEKRITQLERQRA